MAGAVDRAAMRAASQATAEAILGRIAGSRRQAGQPAVPIALIEMGRRLRGINDAQVTALADSIGDVGLLNPITVHPRPVIRNGVSVDGYGLIAGAHRLRACQKLGLVDIEAHVVDLDELQRQIAECDENLCGSVLTPSERALFTRRRKEAYEALHPETRVGAGGRGGKDRKVYDNNPAADRFTADTAAKTGRSESSVQKDAARGTISERALAALRGTHLDKGAYLDELRRLDDEETQLLAIQRDLDAARAALAAAKDIRAARQKTRHAVRLAHMDMVAKRGEATARSWWREGDSSDGPTFPVIYADPPWTFVTRSDVTGGEKAAPYPTMTLADIMALGCPAARDAVLFLWVTDLANGLDCLRGWGFSFKSFWSWRKVYAGRQTGTGYWSFDNEELLLIGTRGNPPAPLPGTQPVKSTDHPIGAHSAKPVFFAETIERLYPGMPRLEMFARSARPGWTSWGFEAGAPSDPSPDASHRATAAGPVTATRAKGARRKPAPRKPAPPRTASAKPREATT